MKKFKYIDSARGIAILLVVLVHSSLSHYTLGIQPTIESIFLCGALGVQMFFVASSLTLNLSWHGREAEPKRVEAFFIRRFFRIAPMYYLGIALYAFLTLYAARLHIPPLHYGPYNASTVTTNIFLVHGLTSYSTLEIVPGGWSIGCEVLFYAVLPWIIFAATSYVKTTVAVVVAVILNLLACQFIFGGIASVHVNDVSYCFLLNQAPTFLCGFYVYRIIQDGKRIPPFVLWIGTVAFALASYWAVDKDFGILIPIFSGIAFGCLILLLKLVDQKLPNWLAEIGKKSYSIYILHWLFAMGLSPMILSKAHLLTKFGLPIGVLMIWVLSVLCAYGLACITNVVLEKPMIDLGHRIAKNIQRPVSAQTAPTVGENAAL